MNFVDLRMQGLFKFLRFDKNSENPGGALDQILAGDVPSRLQKHTRSLYQFSEKVYPTLYKFFEKVYPTLYISSKNLENRYRSLYQNCEN